MCPVHVFWAEVRRRDRPGHLISQSIYRRNFARALGDLMARVGSPSADRYRSRGFRLGAPQALKETGPRWAAVATSGLWRPPSFRGTWICRET